MKIIDSNGELFVSVADVTSELVVQRLAAEVMRSMGGDFEIQGSAIVISVSEIAQVLADSIRNFNN